MVVTGVPRGELARRGVAVPEPKPGLVGADGRRVEVPGPVFDALVQAAAAMAHGQGVTVIPQNALLTTQEAAELLGISRPTLVRLLEDGEIPYEQRGRHRRVMLADLLAYQASMRRERREALDRMAQEGQAAGLYEARADKAVHRIAAGNAARQARAQYTARFEREAHTKAEPAAQRQAEASDGIEIEL